MTRRAFIAASLVAAPAIAYGSSLDISLTRLKISSYGLKIIQISDLHLTKETHKYEKVASYILKTKPDIVVFTGDYVDSADNLDLLKDSISNFRKRNIFVAACLGNHDYFKYRRTGEYVPSSFVKYALQDSELLINSSVSFRKKGVKITIYGVADVICDTPVTPEKRSADFSLGLVHNPDGKKYLSSLKCNLTLSGHTHGGQINLPGIREALAPIEDKKYVYGMKEYSKGLKIFITRGLGALYNYRLFCPPEIVEIYA